MPHDTTYHNANRVGQQIYDLISATRATQDAIDSATAEPAGEQLQDAFDELQRMNKRQLIAAWDGLLQHHDRAEHIARRLARTRTDQQHLLSDPHTKRRTSASISSRTEDVRELATASPPGEEAAEWDCDECDNVISGPDGFSDEHSSACSLHPDNLV